MGPDRTSRAHLGVAAGGLGSLFVAAALVGIRGEIAAVALANELGLACTGAPS